MRGYLENTVARDLLILRDPRESPRKCSLTPLRGFAGIRIRNYHPDQRLSGEGRVLLHHEGEELGPDDQGAQLLLIDCSWRRVPGLLSTIDMPYVLRRLPPFVSAYPRRSKTFEDPAQGLASIEALYAANFILSGAADPELLAAYRWRDEFLRLNPSLG